MTIIFKYLVGLVLLFQLNLGLAQDLVVTSKGDSVNCKISKIDKEYLYFTHYSNNEINSTLIQNSDVISYKYDFYPFVEVPLEYVLGYKNYDRFYVGVNIGLSNRVAKVHDEVPPTFKDYFEELKSGISVGLDMGYYVTKNYGFGFKVNKHNAYSIMDDIVIEDEFGKEWHGSMVDVVAITYFAPSFNMRFTDKYNKYACIMALSIGYMGFFQEQTIVINPTIYTGSTVGTSLDLGFDMEVVGDLSLGVQFSMLTGVIREMYVDDGTSKELMELDEGYYEGLGRLDFSAGLRYSF